MLASAVLLISFFVFIMLLMWFAAEETERTGRDVWDRIADAWRYATTEDDEE